MSQEMKPRRFRGWNALAVIIIAALLLPMAPAQDAGEQVKEQGNIQRPGEKTYTDEEIGSTKARVTSHAVTRWPASRASLRGVASGSLREVFERIVRYHPVVSDALTLQLSRGEDRYRFSLDVPQGRPAPAFGAIDAFAAIYLRT